MGFDRAALAPFFGVFYLCIRVPLHVGGVIGAAGAKRRYMIDHVAGARSAWLAGGWAEGVALKFCPGATATLGRVGGER